MEGSNLKKVGICFGVASGYALYNSYKFGHFQSLKNTLLGLTDHYELSGTVAPGFEIVRDVFADNLRHARDLASQFCVYYKGKKVVDLYGIGEKSGDREYNADSLQVVFSSSKVVTAIVVAWMVDKGYLSYDERIARYWPAFAQNGKEEITLAQLMRHEAGLDCYKVPLSEELWFTDGKDKRIAEIIESTAPEWSPESKRCYHTVLRGTTINEIVKRADPRGRTVGEILGEEIRTATGADFFFGLPEELESRVSPVFEEGRVGTCKTILPLILGISPDKDILKYMRPGAFGFDRVSNSMSYRAKPHEGPFAANSRKFHASHIPSITGMTNARSLAKIGNWFLHGGVRPETLKKALRVSTPRMLDVGIGVETVFADGGFSKDLHEADLAFKGYYGWDGYGGSLIFFNPEKDLVISFTMTGLIGTFLGAPRSTMLWKAVEQAIMRAEEAVR